MPKPCSTKSCRGKAHGDDKFCYGCKRHLLHRMQDEGYLTDTTWIDHGMKRDLVSNRPSARRATDDLVRNRVSCESHQVFTQYHGGSYHSKGGK